jgi:Reverse transcriptase (RNA-dependent DNA polymerase)
LVFIDDIIIIGNNLDEIRKVKAKLREMFDIKDLGLLKYFLGIEIVHSPRGLFMSQKKFRFFKGNQKIRV